MTGQAIAGLLVFLFLLGTVVALYNTDWAQSHQLRRAHKHLAESNRIIASLRETNRDLDAQVRELLSSHPITAAELSEISRIRAEHLSLIETQNAIAVYLRNFYADEIERGDHAGMELETLVKMYLGRYKRLMLEKEKEEKAKGE
jgi:hypothetical protein